MKKYSNDELWNYLHDMMDEVDKLKLESQIKEDSSLMQQISDLKAFDTDVRKHVTSQAPRGFADKVMDAFITEMDVVEVPLKTKVNKSLIRSIFIFFGLTLSACLVLVFTQISFESQAVGEVSDYILSFSEGLQTEIMVNTLYGLFLLTSLLFLDRYLTSKRTLAI